MGGRGGSSGMGSSKTEGTKKFNFSVENLPGTEKQKAWAQSIVDDALNTVNANISNASPGGRLFNEDRSGALAKERRRIYAFIGEQLINGLKTYPTAGDIINKREKFAGDEINNLASAIRNQIRNGRDVIAESEQKKKKGSSRGDLATFLFLLCNELKILSLLLTFLIIISPPILAAFFFRNPNFVWYQLESRNDQTFLFEIIQQKCELI